MFLDGVIYCQIFLKTKFETNLKTHSKSILKRRQHYILAVLLSCNSLILKLAIKLFPQGGVAARLGCNRLVT